MLVNTRLLQFCSARCLVVRANLKDCGMDADFLCSTLAPHIPWLIKNWPTPG